MCYLCIVEKVPDPYDVHLDIPYYYKNQGHRKT